MLQEEQEKKKQQQLEKKAEVKALLEQEMASIKPNTKAPPQQKMTRAQITQLAEKQSKEQTVKPVVITFVLI